MRETTFVVTAAAGIAVVGYQCGGDFFGGNFTCTSANGGSANSLYRLLYGGLALITFSFLVCFENL